MIIGTWFSIDRGSSPLPQQFSQQAFDSSGVAKIGINRLCLLL
jgi:hypothetical protein